ncbi:hypothetical protein E2C01_080146 [Portunus trituberculatus]|uniref:Uncharacterized protein n=1 Tax=Portunus trituberculatus TaxID=210409 RepID=A0A5B7ISD8_PORTR|nr:hypothetical protein [Portunus trituberculatus]
MAEPCSSSPLINISGMEEVDGERIRAGEEGRVREWEWSLKAEGDRLRGLRARGTASFTLSGLSRRQSLLDRRCAPGGASSGSPPTLNMAAEATRRVSGRRQAHDLPE